MLAGAFLLLLAAVNAETPIVAESRTPLVLLALTPDNTLASITDTPLFAIADRTLRAHTRMLLRSLDQIGASRAELDECPLTERMSCWASIIERTNDRRARILLLVLSIAKGSGEAERLTAILVDENEAVELHRNAPREDPRWVEKAENAIYQRSTKTPAEELDLDVPANAQRYFERLFTEQMRGQLENAGLFGALASIRIDGVRPGLGIAIDRAPVGETQGEIALITDVATGTKRIQLSDPEGDFSDVDMSVELEPGEEERIRVELIPTHRSTIRITHQVLFWSGVAVSAAGAALTIYAVARAPDGEVRESCPGCASKRDTAFANFCQLGAERASTCDAGGVRAAPLGFAIGSVGLTWSIGELLTPSDDIPWISAVAGAVIGGLAYGVAILAGG